MAVSPLADGLEDLLGTPLCSHLFSLDASFLLAFALTF